MTERPRFVWIAMMPDKSKAARRRRRLNPALDGEILRATADLLEQLGYDAMSIEGIAARAGVGKATIYRRWSGKAPLVLDAVRARNPVFGDSPDTGELRTDLLALFADLTSQLDASAFAQIAGVLVAIRGDAELRQAVNDLVLGTWARATRAIIERAVARGEIVARPDTVLALIVKVGPSVLAVRYITSDGPVDTALTTRLVDEVLLPILTAS